MTPDLLADLANAVSKAGPPPADLDCLAQSLKANAARLQMGGEPRAILLRIAADALQSVQHLDLLRDRRLFRRQAAPEPAPTGRPQ